MILTKPEALERIKDWADDSIYVLADFDRTLTVGKSDSSWGILSKSGLVPEEYVTKRTALYNHYRPIEIDESLDFDTKSSLMEEWWGKHISLLVEYRLSEEVVERASKDPKAMAFREGAKEFLESMQARNIPVIIISAGLGNFVEKLLTNNGCNFDNIFIVSNFLKFADGVAVGIEDNIIHSLNKNEVSLPDEVKAYLARREHIILMGDTVSDIQMARKEAQAEALKIGFLEDSIEHNLPYYEAAFDVVGIDDTSFTELCQELPILSTQIKR